MTQNELKAQVHDVLGDDYVSLEVTEYTLKENIGECVAFVTCDLLGDEDGLICPVEGRGVGMLDALFNGLKAGLSDRFPSLNHIHFVDFSISGDFSQALPNSAGSDAVGVTQLEVENTSGRRFVFETQSPSITAGSVSVVVAAVEHFVNAELAVLRIVDWIQNARERRRPDLAERYTQRLAVLVKNASYSESIERRKQALEL